uniref:Uncharacterized protein n=1 Tax=Glossina morsitans morsitans TaxID=37546 RepID=A0A1B0G283_GLOMM
MQSLVVPLLLLLLLLPLLYLLLIVLENEYKQVKGKYYNKATQFHSTQPLSYSLYFPVLSTALCTTNTTGTTTTSTTITTTTTTTSATTGHISHNAEYYNIFIEYVSSSVGTHT